MTSSMKRVVVTVAGGAICATVIGLLDRGGHTSLVSGLESTAFAYPPEEVKDCVQCHTETSPGIVSHWKG